MFQSVAIWISYAEVYKDFTLDLLVDQNHL